MKDTLYKYEYASFWRDITIDDIVFDVMNEKTHFKIGVICFIKGDERTKDIYNRYLFIATPQKTWYDTGILRDIATFLEKLNDGESDIW